MICVDVYTVLHLITHFLTSIDTLTQTCRSAHNELGVVHCIRENPIKSEALTNYFKNVIIPLAFIVSIFFGKKGVELGAKVKFLSRSADHGFKLRSYGVRLHTSDYSQTLH